MERDSTWKYMDSTMVSSDNLRGMSWKITLFLGHQSVIFAKWNYGMVLEKSAAQIESTEIEVLRFWAVFCSEFEVFFLSWMSSLIINDHQWSSWLMKLRWTYLTGCFCTSFNPITKNWIQQSRINSSADHHRSVGCWSCLRTRRSQCVAMFKPLQPKKWTKGPNSKDMKIWSLRTLELSKIETSDSRDSHSATIVGENPWCQNVTLIAFDPPVWPQNPVILQSTPL